MIESIIADFQFTSKSHVINHFGSTGVEVLADRDRIIQVLINLITNAIKYSPKADKITVTTKKMGSKVEVCIQDFGPGIPKEEQEKIFERFFRSHNKAESNISGLGLGLYISTEIIRRHRGKLWVESTKGKGSKFYFSLPIN